MVENGRKVERGGEEQSVMFDIFRSLRGDVRDYLVKNLKSAEYYMEQRIQERNLEGKVGNILSTDSHKRWMEYGRHKKAISKLCGWDIVLVDETKYNQDMYELAMSYIIARLMI